LFFSRHPGDRSAFADVTEMTPHRVGQIFVMLPITFIG